MLTLVGTEPDTGNSHPSMSCKSDMRKGLGRYLFNIILWPAIHHITHQVVSADGDPLASMSSHIPQVFSAPATVHVYDKGAWTVFVKYNFMGCHSSYHPQAVSANSDSSGSSHIPHEFSNSAPAIVRLWPAVRDEDKRRFIILVLLYSETRRLDVIRDYY
jgi:hypothetical protein